MVMMGFSVMYVGIVNGSDGFGFDCGCSALQPQAGRMMSRLEYVRVGSPPRFALGSSHSRCQSSHGCTT